MASRSIVRAERLSVRGAGRLALLVAALFLCVPLHGLWRLFRQFSPWPRIFLGMAGRAIGADTNIVGQPFRSNVLFIANHLSWIDILVVAGATGSAFVAKADMRPWPIIGWLATLNNSVYVAREDRLSAGTQANALRTALETHQPVTLFPEGTTGDGLALLPFRPALIAAVAPPPEGIYIQPVAIDYGHLAPVIAWTDDESIGINAIRILNRKDRMTVTLHFLEPLMAEEQGDRKRIAAISRERIGAILHAFETPINRL